MPETQPTRRELLKGIVTAIAVPAAATAPALATLGGCTAVPHQRADEFRLRPGGRRSGFLPAAVSGKCEVLVRSRLFPIISEVSSTHTILELGADRSVEVGDVATLIGPDNPAIAPHVVAERVGMSFYNMITKFSPFLPKRVV